MNTEKKTNRKEWVKNAAIIFLSVMLVLTFFSNTIMNYSLPEVATAMVESGSITAKIRGTGNLVSEDPYKVTIKESRKIASVAVKQGDVVEKDQILFYLEDEDSAELEEAQKALDELVLAYSTSILSGEISNEAYENVQAGKTTSISQYQSEIAAAKDRVEELQQKVTNLNKQIAIMGTASTDSIDKETRLKQAQTELASAETKKAEAKNNLETARTNAAGVSSLQADYNNALMDEGMKKTTYEASAKYLDQKLRNQNTSYAGKYADSTAFFNDFENIVSGKSTNLDLTTLTQMVIAADGKTSVSGNDIYSGEAGAALTQLQADYEEYKNAVSKTLSSRAKLDAAQTNSDVAKYQKAYDTAAENYQYWLEASESLQKEINLNTADNKKADSSLQLQLTEANTALETAKTELTQLLTDIGGELSLGNQNSIIREQREKIAKLKENAVGAVIKAPIAGTVTSVNKIAGETTTPEEELAVMQPEGKGFSMSFSVTAEQAKKVTVGEQAEIQNSWYYNDIAAFLAAIRPDPEGGGGKKLLVFNVTGDVQAGQSVSVSIGQKSASYDLLVPNSAIREDNNGKFILTVESKSSPLGNRYIATRVDVEVLGSDDTKTAISAPLYGYEYVITTSTQPVEAGKQVRLAEN